MKRFQLESKFLREGFDAVIGCDEVGRGCLAGPVVAASVTFQKPVRMPKWWKHVHDSKMLKPHIREELSAEILSSALGWGIGVVENDTIDMINIHYASLLAMKQAVEQLVVKLKLKNPYLLLDGKFTIHNISYTQQAIVTGDSKVHSIAAASIVAKVYRDSRMTELHEKYPHYGLDMHKGYATRMHREAVQAHGLSPVHRVSFCGKIAK